MLRAASYRFPLQLGKQLRSYSSSVFAVPNAYNEPVLSFGPGSSERTSLKKTLDSMKDRVEDIPCVIGGKEIFSGNIQKQVAPFDHKRVVANIHYASKDMIVQAIEAAMKARPGWDAMPLEQRAAVFLKAADLITTKYRMEVLATTMLGQAKTAFQAEIDATCELADFLRFGVQYAMEIHKSQPSLHSNRTWNRTVYRGLEGFVAAISPFNFTAIGGNLVSSPALMGNVVLWKPSDTAMLSNWTVFKVLREAGVPDGVINFVPANGPLFGDVVVSSPHLAAINFTGSTRTFKHLWGQVGKNIDSYRTYPRLVGECGGKNFHYVHPSADPETVVNSSIRSAFEYSGQKCSAASRMYIPESLWPQVRDGMVTIMKKMKIGSPEDFTSFTSAVIDEAAFKRIAQYIDLAKSNSELKILVGGVANDSVGYFIEPTLIQTTNPKHRIFEEEIFGPVLSVYVYHDKDWESVLHLVDETSPYGLTGSVFARDRAAIQKASAVLRNSAGNFYINDKSTGAVVGQQPFGGARASGTNDKAGAAPYLLRWVSPVTIKETFVPITDWSYPSVDKC
ncbi:hypothetical protein EMCRGX_G016608 [Ephydatia muelleri]